MRLSLLLPLHCLTLSSTSSAHCSQPSSYVSPLPSHSHSPSSSTIFSPSSPPSHLHLLHPRFCLPLLLHPLMATASTQRSPTSTVYLQCQLDVSLLHRPR